MPALTYIGNCEWEPSSEPQPSTPYKELPTIREPWIGRSDKIAQFLASKAVGSAYLGGYILDNTPRDNTPFFGVASVELTIALPPEFHAAAVVNSTRSATATKSATVNNSSIIDGASEIAAVREVAFDSPSTRYSYWASDKPLGARFSTAATTAPPILRRSSIRASGNGEDRNYTSQKYPAPLVSALFMAVIDRVTDHEAEEVVGTPWYRCTDVVSREFQGD